jgi:hypothetical protein
MIRAKRRQLHKDYCKKFLSLGRDSNPRPRPYQGRAIPG